MTSAVDGDPAGRGDHAHRLDRLPLTPRMDREQGVVAGAGTVHPGQPALHPEPVSSNPATSPAGICSRTCSRNPSSRPVARAVSAAIVPDDSGTPDNSASASAVRSLRQELPGVQVNDDRGDPRAGPRPATRDHSNISELFGNSFARAALRWRAGHRRTYRPWITGTGVVAAMRLDTAAGAAPGRDAAGDVAVLHVTGMVTVPSCAADCRR